MQDVNLPLGQDMPSAHPADKTADFTAVVKQLGQYQDYALGGKNSEKLEVAIPAVDNKTVKTYRAALRSIVRGLWSGVINMEQAYDAFLSTISRQFRQAWNAGAAECGIRPDEMTEEEQAALSERIVEETQYIGGYLEAIEAQSRANGGNLTPLFTRAELWINRFNEVVNQAKGMACADQKGQWQLGPTEQHCPSCSGFNGRVYRFSVWERNGAMPQSSRLACRGYRCQCSIVPTDGPITRGRFPARLLS